MPLVGYMFSDGPWRDAMIRFKYDPRKELDARMCVFYLLLLVNTHCQGLKIPTDIFSEC
jgi:hypothetical protein